MKENKIFQIVIVCFFLLPLSVFSQQVPGYLGKKLSLFYDLGICPNYTSISLLNVVFEEFDGEMKPIYLSHGFGMDYCISKKVELSYKVKFFKSEKLNRYHVNGYSYDLFHDTKAFTIDMGCNYFMKNYIAPVGDFMRFSMFYTRVSEDVNQVIESDIDEKIDNTIIDEISTGVFGIGFGMYRKRVVKDRISLTVGFNFVFSTSLMSLAGKYTTNEKVSYNYGDVSYNEIAYKRELGAYHSISHGFINFTLAIGFLAF
jgi:hypothetical protein